MSEKIPYVVADKYLELPSSGRNESVIRERETKNNNFNNAVSVEKNGTLFVEPREVLLVQRKKAEEQYLEIDPDSPIIYSATQLEDLVTEHHATLNRAEFMLAPKLLKYLKSSRLEMARSGKQEEETRNILGAIQEYFIQESRDNKIPTTASAAFRRTALTVYKSARIPPQKVNKGTFKEVKGPIGVGILENGLDDADAFVYSLAQNSLFWDGQVPKYHKLENVSRGAQQAVVKGRRDISSESVSSMRTALMSSEEIHDLPEFELIQDIHAKLPELTILPDIYQKKVTTVNVEYLPNELTVGDIEIAANTARTIATELHKVFQETGVLNTDIKGSNVRERLDGSPVVTDWGAIFTSISWKKLYNM